MLLEVLDILWGGWGRAGPVRILVAGLSTYRTLPYYRCPTDTSTHLALLLAFLA